MKGSMNNLVIESPSLKKAFQAIKQGISKKRTVLVVGKCSVIYKGRASSKLEPGERIVLFKSDGSALVHRSKDVAPINWQPPGCLFRTRLRKDGFSVRVFKGQNKEVLEVFFESVFLIANLELVDSGEFYLYASEEDMKQAILIQPFLLEEGFRVISAERPVKPGFIDILGVDRKNVLTVVEIKRKTAGKEAVLQLYGYLKEFKKNSNKKIRGILVAPGLMKGTQKLLVSLDLEFKALSPQKCVEILKQKKRIKLTEFLSN